MKVFRLSLLCLCLVFIGCGERWCSEYKEYETPDPVCTAPSTASFWSSTTQSQTGFVEVRGTLTAADNTKVSKILLDGQIPVVVEGEAPNYTWNTLVPEDFLGDADSFQLSIKLSDCEDTTNVDASRVSSLAQ